MMRTKNWLYGLMGMMSMGAPALGTVHVLYLDSLNGQVGPIANYASGAAITVNINSSSIAKVMVYSDNSASDNIGTISVTGTNTQPIDLYVAQSRVAVDAFYTNPSDAAGQDFGGIQGNSPSNREVHAKVYVLDDQTGSITVSHLETLQADRVNSNIESARGLFKVKCASVGSGCGSMKQTAGKISRIEVTGTGDCNFDILAQGNGSGTDGDIDVIDVGGQFSPDTTPYPHITAGGRIGRITAGTLRNEISADEEIGSITTTAGGFKGSLTTPTIHDASGGRVQLAGAFEAVTTLDDGLPADSTIVIGDWSGEQNPNINRLFQLQGDNRLAGQVIINANNTTLYGVWYDPIRVVGGSTITLGPSGEGVYYTSTSAALGGGAVGLVPYHLHDTDCVPSNGEWICETWPTLAENDDRQTIILRFYGPILDGTDDSTPPIKVERRVAYWPCCSTPSWNDITTDCDILVAPAGHPREIRVSPGPGIAGDFGHDQSIQITPRLTGGTRDLRCNQTFAATPPQAADFTYFVTTICPLDLMRDNRIDMADFNAWIENPTDVNGDSSADALDGLTIYNMME